MKALEVCLWSECMKFKISESVSSVVISKCFISKMKRTNQNSRIGNTPQFDFGGYITLNQK